MQQFSIQGPSTWDGEIQIDGAKNACLPIMAATLLIDGKVTVANVPPLCDIYSMKALLEDLGISAQYQDRVLVTAAKEGLSSVASYELVKKMRASILVLGPLLAKTGWAKVSLPGGCAIGARPVDQHIKFMEALGASVTVSEGFVIAKAPESGLKGCDYTFDMPTVTGTENAVMAAVLAKGRSILRNAATEPEVLCLIDFLVACGAKIKTSKYLIEIEGVASLNAPDSMFKVIGDRMEAGTYLMGAMMTRGKIKLKGVLPSHMTYVLDLMRQAGAEIQCHESEQVIELEMRSRPKAVSITTDIYPGFPTDLQAQWMALAVVSEGECTITETIFENRMMHACELMRMGAKIDIHGNQAVVKGVESLTGAPVMASDLRASASLVLAACCAKGETVVQRIYHIDRGYADIERKLSSAGVNISRETQLAEV
jgi:UDP-N-acetylglucosamine 1-carboxyvinyltransferase